MSGYREAPAGNLSSKSPQGYLPKHIDTGNGQYAGLRHRPRRPPVPFERGAPIQPSTWWQVWQKVRAASLTPEQLASPLIKRPTTSATPASRGGWTAASPTLRSPRGPGTASRCTGASTRAAPTGSRACGSPGWPRPCSRRSHDRGAQGARKLSHGGDRRRFVSENDIGVICVTAGQSPSGAGSKGRPQQDSNLRSRLRRPLLSPLSYGGCATPKGTSHKPCPNTARCGPLPDGSKPPHCRPDDRRPFCRAVASVRASGALAGCASPVPLIPLAHTSRKDPEVYGLLGEFGGLWCTNGSHKPRSSPIMPDRSASRRTTHHGIHGRRNGLHRAYTATVVGGPGHPNGLSRPVLARPVLDNVSGYASTRRHTLPSPG